MESVTKKTQNTGGSGVKAASPVLYGQAYKTITKHNMIKPGDSVLACISGGADSTALLVVLLELKNQLEISNIYALHINHNIRADSINDEIFVRKLCNTLCIPLEIQNINVAGFAAKNKKGIEEAGRIVRHSAAGFSCGTFKANKIAMGHNLNDNTETILLNLCRGTGLRGLAGIPPVNKSIIRPLIYTDRLDILKYLKHKRQPFVVDASNSSSDYTRNRMRNIIIPALENEINAKAGLLIAKSAELFSSDEEYLTAQASACLSDCAIHIGHDKNNKKIIEICPSKLNMLHFSIASRVVRQILNEFDVTDINQTHVKALLKLSAGQTGKKFNLAGIFAVKEHNKLVFKSFQSTNKGFCYEFAFDKPKYIPEISKTVLISFQNFANNPIPYCTKILKYDNMCKSVKIRSRKPGDCIRLKTNSGTMFTKKLQDYFTDIKLPASMRDNVPLLTYDDEIIWIMPSVKSCKGAVCNESEPENNAAKCLFVTIWEGSNEHHINWIN